MSSAVEIRPIRTNADYKRALKQLEEVWDAKPGSEDEDALDVLATLIDAYEEKRFPIDMPDPIEAIRFRMEQQGLDRKDLEPLIGPRGRVSEVLEGKRPLSITMIRNIHEALDIPAEVLIRPAAPMKKWTIAEVKGVATIKKTARKMPRKHVRVTKPPSSPWN